MPLQIEIPTRTNKAIFTSTRAIAIPNFKKSKDKSSIWSLNLMLKTTNSSRWKSKITIISIFVMNRHGFVNKYRIKCYCWKNKIAFY